LHPTETPSAEEVAGQQVAFVASGDTREQAPGLGQGGVVDVDAEQPDGVVRTLVPGQLLGCRKEENTLAARRVQDRALVAGAAQRALGEVLGDGIWGEERASLLPQLR
jgi:hypothetical protein